MAVTAVNGSQGAQVTTSDAGVSFTIDPARSYTLVHTGKDGSDSDDTSTVWVGYGAAPAAATYAEGTNKFPLVSGSALNLPPLSDGRGEGLEDKIYLMAATGGAPIVAVQPGEKKVQ